MGIRFDVRPEAVYPAKVVEVSKSTTRNNLSFLMTALLPNKQGEWPAGISGKMLLDLPATSSVPMVTVPQTALNHRPTEGDYVWMVDQTTGQVVKRKVILGELLPNGKVEVKDGLQAGDKVYLDWMGKSIVLFQIGEDPLENGMNILGAHVDSPRLDLKQNPLYEESGFAYF